MQNKSSKSIQILLSVIIIILIVIMVLLVHKNKNESEITSSQDITYHTDTNNTVKNDMNTQKLVVFQNDTASFSYKNTAKIIGSGNIVKVGTSENDSALETVEFLPDMNGMDATPYLDNAQYKKEVHGANTFDVFESTEGNYYKHFVLIKGNKAVSIYSKVAQSAYIDLNTVTIK
jgi:hypothetical protein